VDESYASFLNHAGKFSSAQMILQSPHFYREIISRPAILLYPSAMLRLAAFVGGAHLTSRWVERWLQKNSSTNVNELLFYTYWFDQAAMGIGLVKKRFPEIRLVSRAHGYDIYEEYYYKLAFWPCRHTALSFLDRLFPDSQAGTDYLRTRYPEYSSKIKTAFLGVPEPGFVNQPSSDGVFRIVSCSMIRPEKRVGRLLEGFTRAAELRPEQRLEWFHIGNGETRDQLQKQADETLPSNARAYFRGYSDKQSLMCFYRDTPLDVFVNVSATEGTAVSIMEAISCGLPIIATHVGGNPEIVSQQNGMLLSPDVTAQEIADAFFHFIDDPTDAHIKRIRSRELWDHKYNAERNFSDFTDRIMNTANASLDGASTIK
jgi:glycosyltransferase involved in cell wall biosynthesis